MINESNSLTHVSVEVYEMKLRKTENNMVNCDPKQKNKSMFFIHSVKKSFEYQVDFFLHNWQKKQKGGSE